jgi:transcriptional regulator with XRE-family HTH domain
MRIARRKKGLSQAQMADSVGTTQATYSRIESGVILQPDEVILKRISEVLQIPTSEFHTRKDVVVSLPTVKATVLNPKDIPAVLLKLKKLSDEGVIEKEEFEQKKKELLARL